MRASFLALSLLLLSACVSVNKSVLMDRSFAPVPMQDVYVFLEGDEIPEDCRRVAILDASGDESLTDRADLIDEMRKEAGKLGANALILGDLRDPGTGDRVLAAVFDVSAERTGTAVAVWCASMEGGRPEADR